MASHRWETTLDGTVHFIEYTGNTPAGEARVLIDGEVGAYNLVLTLESRYRAMFRIDGRDATLEMDTLGESVALTVDGVAQAESTPPAAVQAGGTTGGATGDAAVDPAVLKAVRRMKSGMGSFLSLAALTGINIVLQLAQASISFPFSAYASTLAIWIGQYFSESTGDSLGAIVGIAAAILITAAYGVLYFLARKRTWPVWVAFGLILVDTALLIYDFSGDLASVIVDIAFHAWIIYSLLSLGLARRHLDRLARQVEAQAPKEPSAPEAAP